MIPLFLSSDVTLKVSATQFELLCILIILEQRGSGNSEFSPGSSRRHGMNVSLSASCDSRYERNLPQSSYAVNVFHLLGHAPPLTMRDVAQYLLEMRPVLQLLKHATVRLVHV